MSSPRSRSPCDPADAWAIDRLARERGLHVVLCYAWNEMGISEQARRLIGGPDGIGEVEARLGRDVHDRARPADRGDHVSRRRRRSPSPRRDLVRSGRVWRWVRARPAHACHWAWSCGSFPSCGRRRSRRSRPGRAPASSSTTRSRPLRGRRDRVDRRGVAAARHLRQPAPADDPDHRVGAARSSWTWRAPRVARSIGADDVDVTVDLSDDDVVWSFDRVTDRMVDLVLGRTTDNPSPPALGARVVEILDGMYRSAASGLSPGSAGTDVREVGVRSQERRVSQLDRLQPGANAGRTRRDTCRPRRDACLPRRDARRPGRDASRPGRDACRPEYSRQSYIVGIALDIDRVGPPRDAWTRPIEREKVLQRGAITLDAPAISLLGMSRLASGPAGGSDPNRIGSRPAELGARVAEILDGNYRGAASGRFEAISQG